MRRNRLLHEGAAVADLAKGTDESCAPRITAHGILIGDQLQRRIIDMRREPPQQCVPVRLE
jgi:hypothetical protein